MRVAIVAIAKNEALYIREWLAYHNLLGVNDFILYNNESDDDTYDILRKARGCNITLKNWSASEGVSPQISAYNDAIKAHGGSYDFCFFIDIDEFLLPTSAIGLKEILSRLPPEAGAVGVNQRVFGSSGLAQHEPGLVIQRFQMCSEADYKENGWIKSCYRMNCIERITSPHNSPLAKGVYSHPDGRQIAFSELKFGESHIAQVAPIDFSLIQLNHYILKSRQEFMLKRARGGAAGQTRQDRIRRYEDMNFFDYRNTVINKAQDSRAAEMAEQVEQKIADIWADN